MPTFSSPAIGHYRRVDDDPEDHRPQVRIDAEECAPAVADADDQPPNEGGECVSRAVRPRDAGQSAGRPGRCVLSSIRITIQILNLDSNSAILFPASIDCQPVRRCQPMSASQPFRTAISHRNFAPQFRAIISHHHFVRPFRTAVPHKGKVNSWALLSTNMPI